MLPDNLFGGPLHHSTGTDSARIKVPILFLTDVIRYISVNK